MLPLIRTSGFFFRLGLGLALVAAPSIGATGQSSVLARQVLGQQVLVKASVPTQVRRGYTQLSSGQVDAAIATFQQAIQQFPRSIEAKLGLAIAYRRAGRDQASWDAYQAVLQQEPDNRLALKTVGLLGGFRPEWQQPGIDALTRFLALEPRDTEAQGQRALLYGYQGRFEERSPIMRRSSRAAILPPTFCSGRPKFIPTAVTLPEA
ncbi:MAG: tetratricopeptide repeat protein [Synechococcales cyanobacterium RU_4_20]|nr:tetratricopeptide repeat protein [Synechococcales cyanobacterium RU_4_20]